MQKRKMTGLGMAGGLADVQAQGQVQNTQSATGSSSQANSFAIYEDITVFTTAASNSGARLPLGSIAGDSFVIANLDSNTMLIYPPTGGWLNNGTVNTGSISLLTKKVANCISVDGTNYLVMVGG